MAARNFEDKTAFIQTHFTHVINTKNVQQDSGEETQIYLPDDGIRNFEDKNAMKRSTEQNLFTE